MNAVRSTPLMTFLLTAATAVSAPAEELKLGKHNFQLADGFTIQQIAAPPLVQRPIHMCFDEDGVLYVTDSSGNTDKAPVQLKNPQHRVLRLVDRDGDGTFDESTVFADKLPLPEGILVHEGAVYVGAPPHIWKLRDSDGDHVADERTVWFDGGSIERCGNDMHGPYLGPDGFFYWCKGAFAPQEHELANGKTLRSRAAHIYRARPDGGQLEMVITGGMNNPVGLAFSETGERFLSGTFFDLSQPGRRDGILHVVYGGMYGRENRRVLAPHPDTGGLLPILTHLGPAAPSGIVMPQHYAAGLQGDLICTEFNTRRLSRHRVSKSGATHSAETSTFLESDQTDFHPTDVIEDADGSLLVADTGSWYMICCPTSKIAKPDVLGAIYRIQKKGSHPVADPRGLKLDWDQPQVGWLSDERPAVVKRAIDALATVDNIEALRKCSEAKDTVRPGGKPNVLFIAIDDLNDWTGMLKGNPQARTPHMDRLASKGMVFTNAHWAAPACGPSRSALMSGIRPSTSGNYENRNSLTKNPILNNSVLLPEFFGRNGYYVCGSGKLFHGAHFRDEVQGRGFDAYYPSKTQDLFPWIDRFSSPRPLNGIKKGVAKYADWGPYHPDVSLEDINDGKTAKWAAETLQGGELKEPFFMGTGIFQPHLPNYALQKYFDQFPLDEIEIPEGYLEGDMKDVPKASGKQRHIAWARTIRAAGQWKHAIQAYLASTAMTDDLIGQIVGALEKSKYADNTIIVLWSDHGFQLGEKERWAKYSLWERATRVNMVWVAPGVTEPGSTCVKPVNLLDIYPTLASLTGCEPPENQLEGNDLTVLMKNPEATWNKASLTTFGFRNYGVRSERYRYIVYADGSEELYDHKQDKWEWRNLAADPEYADIKEKMRKGIPAHHEPIGALQGAFDRKRTRSKK